MKATALQLHGHCAPTTASPALTGQGSAPPSAPNPASAASPPSATNPASEAPVHPSARTVPPLVAIAQPSAATKTPATAVRPVANTLRAPTVTPLLATPIVRAKRSPSPAPLAASVKDLSANRASAATATTAAPHAATTATPALPAANSHPVPTEIQAAVLLAAPSETSLLSAAHANLAASPLVRSVVSTVATAPTALLRVKTSRLTRKAGSVAVKVALAVLTAHPTASLTLPEHPAPKVTLTPNPAAALARKNLTAKPVVAALERRSPLANPAEAMQANPPVALMPVSPAVSPVRSPTANPLQAVQANQSAHSTSSRATRSLLVTGLPPANSNARKGNRPHDAAARRRPRRITA